MSTQSQTGTLIREQLAQATEAWVASGLDPELLLSRERLEETEAWVTESGSSEQLSQAERELLVVSRAAAGAQQRDANRRRRTRGRWVWALALFALGMTAFASYASRSFHSTAAARDSAASRTVALEATRLESTDPALAEQLALVAYRISRTTQARSALLDLTSGPISTRLSGPIGGPTSIALGDDGHRVAAAYTGDGEVRIYSLRYAHLTRLITLFTEDTNVPRTGPASTVTATTTAPVATVTGAINTNITTLETAKATLNAVAISSNGDLVAAGGTKDDVVLWNVSSPTRPRKLASLSVINGATVNGLSFSPAGSQLAVVASDGILERWSLTNPAHPVALRSFVDPRIRVLRAVTYSPDGSTITAVGSNGRLLVWPLHSSNPPITTLTAGHDVLTSVAYNPAGTQLVTGTGGGRVYVWAVSKAGKLAPARAPLRAGHGSVDSVAFSRGGTYLSAGGAEGSVSTWSTSAWTPVSKQTGPAAVTGLAYTDDNRRVLSIDAHGTIRLTQFAPSSADVIHAPVSLLAYTQDASKLGLISANGKLQWWDTSDEWNPAPSNVGAIPRVTGSQASGGVQALGPGQFIPPVPTATDPDPAKPGWRQLATVNHRDQVELWSIAKGRHARLISTLATGGAGRILGLALSPDGQLLAAATSKDQIVLWQLVSLAHPLTVNPRLVAKFGHFSQYPYAVAFSPNNSHLLIAGGSDQTVELWNVTNLDKLEPVSDATPPRLLSAPFRGLDGSVLGLAVSPDGQTLAASTSSGQVWLWNINRPAKSVLIATLTAAHGDVSRIAFSPSDNTLVAVSNQSRLTFWHYRAFQAVNRVCAYAGTVITKAEWYQYVPARSFDPPCRHWTAPVLTSTTTTPAP